MIYWDVEQRSEQWHNLRHCSIGGSELKSLFVKDLEDSEVFYTLLSENMEDFEMEETFMSAAMERGIELEPDAIFSVSLNVGYQFEECGKHDKFSFLHNSPDGLTKDGKVALEVKCPSAKVHAKYLLNDIVPEEYVYQIVSYFLNIKELEKMYFGSYRPENVSKPLFVKEITRTTELVIGHTRATKNKPKEPILAKVEDLVKQAEEKAEVLQGMIDKALEEINNR